MKNYLVSVNTENLESDGILSAFNVDAVDMARASARMVAYEKGTFSETIVEALEKGDISGSQLMVLATIGLQTVASGVLDL